MRRLLLLALLCLAPAALAEAQELRGTLKKIKDSETIALGYRDSARPFAFAGPDGKPAGYSVDLCLRVAESVREQLGLSAIKTPWTPVTAETRIPLVVAGTVDLECGSTTITLGRQATVDFSILTFVDGGSLLTRIGSNVSSVADLANKRVAVIPGTTTEKALASALQKSWVSTASVVAVRDHTEGLAPEHEGVGLVREVLVADPESARVLGALQESHQDGPI